MPNQTAERHTSPESVLIVVFQKERQDWKRGGERRKMEQELGEKK